MIARADGQVVLVAGAIPGERVTVRVERVGKGVVYAETTAVEEASADRREPFTDPQCGGCLYAHIDYARQLELKALVIADAFARIGRIVLPAAVAVAPSRQDGYRMRARLHVRGRRVGFFREGTHDICDARATRQLLPATSDAIDRLVAALRSLAVDTLREIDVSENLDASERAVHLDGESLRLDLRVVRPAVAIDGITGVTAGRELVAGRPFVTDRLAIEGGPIALRRHTLAFFQGNRYLLAALVGHVLSQVADGVRLVDLYAGVGLFAVTAAAVRHAVVTAVEGDRMAASDLEANAREARVAVEAVHQPVEAFVARPPQSPDLLIVDPPRTGMSREALDGAIALRAPQVVYVSCDVATLARDTRRLVDAGYTVARVDAFDLFPNTPHVETIVVFNR